MSNTSELAEKSNVKIKGVEGRRLRIVESRKRSRTNKKGLKKTERSCGKLEDIKSVK